MTRTITRARVSTLRNGQWIHTEEFRVSKDSFMAVLAADGALWTSKRTTTNPKIVLEDDIIFWWRYENSTHGG